MQKLILIISACSILCACGEAIEPKSFYVENDAARKAKLAWCADRPDVEYSSGNCLNAGIALQEKIETLKENRKLIRQQRWDTRSSLRIEREKCGPVQNTETYKTCLEVAEKERGQKHKEMTAFNGETDSLIDVLK